MLLGHSSDPSKFMDKIWFICIDEKEEGPFSAKELAEDPRVTLDTLVWREGFPDWVPLRRIKSLRKYFERESQDREPEEPAPLKLTPQEELVIDHGKDPNFYFLLLALLLSLLLYLFYVSLRDA